MFDLEDSVVDEQKAAARTMVRAVLDAHRGPVPCYVRVNGADIRHFSDDVAALAQSPCAGIVVPKVESIDGVRRVVAEANGLGVVLLLETPRGMLRALDLADAAGDSLRALAFGAEDLRASMRVDASESAALIAFALPTIAAAAAAVGVPAIDSPELDITDDATGCTSARPARARSASPPSSPSTRRNCRRFTRHSPPRRHSASGPNASATPMSAAPPKAMAACASTTG